MSGRKNSRSYIPGTLNDEDPPKGVEKFEAVYHPETFEWLISAETLNESSVCTDLHSKKFNNGARAMAPWRGLQLIPSGGMTSSMVTLTSPNFRFWFTHLGHQFFHQSFYKKNLWWKYSESTVKVHQCRGSNLNIFRLAVWKWVIKVEYESSRQAIHELTLIFGMWHEHFVN